MPVALAQELTSASYILTSNILDSSGGGQNSSSYKTEITLGYVSGQTSSQNFTADIGFFFGQIAPILTFPTNVAFRLSFNINGISGDSTYVGSIGTGFYRSNNISGNYGCVDDLNNAFGIVMLGTLDYINASSGNITVSETHEGNRFAIPVVGRNCSFIGTKVLVHPLQAFLPTGEAIGAIELVLEYPGIDIRGDYERTGIFTLVIERNESDDKQLIFDII